MLRIASEQAAFIIPGIPGRDPPAGSKALGAAKARASMNAKCLYFDGLPGQARQRRHRSNDGNPNMRPGFVRKPLALLLAALPLAACASRSEPAAYAAAAPVEDDDAFCRQGGKVAVGSPDYVYCRKDRDAARNAAVSRSDRKQRGLAEYMLNNPTRP